MLPDRAVHRPPRLSPRRGPPVGRGAPPPAAGDPAALESYAAVALGVGGSELAPGERVARELVALAPYRERGHALLMEILTARGNSAEALRIYEELRQRLRDELGATPAPELRELQQRLLRR